MRIAKLRAVLGASAVTRSLNQRSRGPRRHYRPTTQILHNSPTYYLTLTSNERCESSTRSTKTKANSLVKCFPTRDILLMSTSLIHFWALYSILYFLPNHFSGNIYTYDSMGTSSNTFIAQSQWLFNKTRRIVWPVEWVHGLRFTGPVV